MTEENTNNLSKLCSYLQSLDEPQDFTDIEKSLNHPFKGTIHRIVETKTTEEETKKGLSKARSNPQEFIKIRLSNKQFEEVEMPKCGISCSDKCVHVPLVKNGVIPLIKINEWFAWTKDSITNDRCYLQFGGEPLPIMRCYNRDISNNSSLQITVGQAMECFGKHDSCRMDQNFSFCCYWDTANHAIMSIQSKVSREAFTETDSHQAIIFDSSIFNYDAWKWCGPDKDMVKFPRAFMNIVKTETDSIDDAIQKLSEPKREPTRALFAAFLKAPIGKATQELDCLMIRLFDSSDLNALEWQNVYDLIDEYADDIYGWDTSHWEQILKPKIQFFINELNSLGQSKSLSNCEIEIEKLVGSTNMLSLKRNKAVIAVYFKHEDCLSVDSFINEFKKEAALFGLSSFPFPPIEGNSVTVIFEIEDIDQDEDIFEIFKKMPPRHIPDLYSINVLVSDEPNEKGFKDYRLNWGGCSGYDPPLEVNLQVDLKPTLSIAEFCVGVTKKQRPCGNKTRDESKFCWHHRK